FLSSFSAFCSLWLFLRSNWFITYQCALKCFETGFSILCNDGFNACSDCATPNEYCVVSRKQNDPGAWTELSHLLRSIQSVRRRNGEIENDSVGVQFLNHFDSLFAVRSFGADFQVGALL